MSKRFTSTDKWSDPWFCGLSLADRHFWGYLQDNCDNAGVWAVNWPLVRFYIPGYQCNLENFGERIKVLSTEKWYLPGFIEEQYGKLSEACKPHVQVLALLKKHRVSIGYPKGMHTLKDKDKDKDRDGVEGGFAFDPLWQKYPKRLGRNLANKYFRSSVSTEQDYADINRALDNYLAYIQAEKTDPKYIKHGSTWFNNWRDWVDFKPTTAVLTPSWMQS